LKGGRIGFFMMVHGVLMGVKIDRWVDFDWEYLCGQIGWKWRLFLVFGRQNDFLFSFWMYFLLIFSSTCRVGGVILDFGHLSLFTGESVHKVGGMSAFCHKVPKDWPEV
jgi:hypothetical protein